MHPLYEELIELGIAPGKIDAHEGLSKLSQVAAEHEHHGLADLCLLLSESLGGRVLPEAEWKAWFDSMRDYLDGGELDRAVESMLEPLVRRTSAPKTEIDLLRTMLVGEHAGADSTEIEQEPTRSSDLVLEDDEVESDVPAASTPEGSAVRFTVRERSTSAVPPHIRELIELVRGQTRKMRRAAPSHVHYLRSEVALERERHVHQLERQLVGLAHAAGSIGFDGLIPICENVARQVRAMKQAPASRASIAALDAFLEGLDNYLESPLEHSRADRLIEVVDDMLSASDMADEDSRGEWLAFLKAPRFSLAESMPEERTRYDMADSGTLSFEVPGDAAPELTDALLVELPPQSASLAGLLQRAFHSGADAELIKEAQRTAHTIKGAASTVGVAGIATLMHLMEDALSASTVGARMPSRLELEVMVEAADCLEDIVEALVDGTPVPDGVLDTLAALQAIGPSGTATASGSTAQAREAVAATRTDDASIIDDRTTDIRGREQSQSESASASAAPGSNDPLVRLPARLIDDLLHLLGEMIIKNGQVQESLADTSRNAQALKDSYRRVSADADEFSRALDLDSSRTALRGREKSHFDPLEMEQYDSLYSGGQRLLESALGTGELSVGVSENLHGLEDGLRELMRIQREAQDSLLDARMVPASTIVPRLQRAVRQSCRVARKSAQLFVHGADTKMDNEIVTALLDPLMHLLRNAVDHGIESADSRRTAGKPDNGVIELLFERIGSSVRVECRDDGAGFDIESIRNRARQMAFDDQVALDDDDALLRLTLLPSFTTRSNVTQLSGRGVGLDVVLARVRALGGAVEIDSQRGQGAKISLSIPVTQHHTHALIVRVANERYAIADRNVEQVIAPSLARVVQRDDATALAIAGVEYLCVDFEAAMGLSRSLVAAQKRYYLIVQISTGYRAVGVDAVLGAQDVIQKQLGPYMPRLNGLIGLTVLGNGEITPILDLPELLEVDSWPLAQVRTSGDVANPILVVDDSISARRALVQMVEDAGYDVVEARDGVEAVARIHDRRPRLLLLDLEMPRMNGIEVLRHVRAEPDLRQLPVVVITSRTTGKHRDAAMLAGADAYITKPYQEDNVLATIVELLNDVELETSNHAQTGVVDLT